jgi:hypothetical protein
MKRTTETKQKCNDLSKTPVSSNKNNEVILKNDEEEKK